MDKYSILVYVECAEGRPVRAALEAICAAKQLAAQKGGTLAAVVVDNAAAAADVAAYGVENVLSVTLGSGQTEAVAAALAAVYADAQADYLLLGSGRDGKEIAARVAARADVGYLSDVTELAADGWVRSIYSGSLRETVALNGRGVLSVRSGSFGKPELVEGVTAQVSDVAVPACDLRSVVREAVVELSEDVNLEDAEVIVAGGRGMGNAENFQLVYRLAEVLGGAVGASRPATEEGWVPRNYQIGQSGKIVAPKLYIACGISGAAQHISGAAGAGYIVAINKDADAPIFETADVGIVGNVTDVLPLLIEEIEKRKS